MDVGDVNVGIILELGCLVHIFSKLYESMVDVFLIILIRDGFMIRIMLRWRNLPGLAFVIKESDVLF